MREKGQTYYTFLSGLPEPLFELRLRSDGTALTGIDFADDASGAFAGPGPATPADPDSPQWTRADELPILRQTAAELREYFAGTRTDFTVRLALAGTAFQQAVWAQLCRIPYGATWSYAELARRIGRPQASRAVGAANGSNPVPIIVPCHRVIGASGQLTGYGGGLPRKLLLLQLEQRAGLPTAERARSFARPSNRSAAGSAAVPLSLFAEVRR